MVRWNKKEKHDKRILLSSLNQMDTEKHEDAVNGKSSDIAWTRNMPYS